MTATTSAPVSYPDRFFIGGAVGGAVVRRHDRRDRRRHRGALLQRGRGPGRRHVPSGRGGPHRVRRGARGPRMTHAERAGYLRALGAAVQERSDALAELWPRESGTIAPGGAVRGDDGAGAFESYAALADTFPFEELAQPSMGGGFGLLVREPVGVVGAIIPWNAPLQLISHKIGPALLAGCSVVLKLSPEAPGEGYLVAEAAEQIGLPPGRAQRRHRRPRGVGAARARPAGRQDHLHRLDRRGPQDRVALRRAHRPLHARARREVGGGRPRRRRHRDGGRVDRRRRVHHDRPGVLVAHPDRRHP